MQVTFAPCFFLPEQTADIHLELWTILEFIILILFQCSQKCMDQMIGYPKTGLLATENDGLGFSMSSMERDIYIYNMVFYDVVPPFFGGGVFVLGSTVIS